LFNLHRYILFQDPPKPSKAGSGKKQSSESGGDSEPDILKLREEAGDWKAKRILKALEVEREAAKYI